MEEKSFPRRESLSPLEERKTCLSCAAKACFLLILDRYQYSSHISHPPTSEHPLSRLGGQPGDQLHQKVTALFMQPNSQHIKQFSLKGQSKFWSETKLDPRFFFKSTTRNFPAFLNQCHSWWNAISNMFHCLTDLKANVFTQKARQTLTAQCEFYIYLKMTLRISVA